MAELTSAIKVRVDSADPNWDPQKDPEVSDSDPCCTVETRKAAK